MIHWHTIRNKDGTRDQYAIAGAVDGVDLYTVAKVGTGEGTRYELWEGRHMASSHGTADEARAHAEVLASANVRHLARATDPDTSVMAARRTVASGRRDAHVSRIVAAVNANPGATSAELAQITGLERHEAARRTSDAAHDGLIRKRVGPDGKPMKRTCGVSGHAAVVWLPALTESQQTCLQGAA